jgi:hypothetical protein
MGPGALSISRQSSGDFSIALSRSRACRASALSSALSF